MQVKLYVEIRSSCHNCLQLETAPDHFDGIKQQVHVVPVLNHTSHIRLLERVSHVQVPELQNDHARRLGTLWHVDRGRLDVDGQSDASSLFLDVLNLKQSENVDIDSCGFCPQNTMEMHAQNKWTVLTELTKLQMY